MSKLEAALDCARRGFAVFPLIPNDKRPLIENWQNLATTDPEKIRKCWTEDPERNIGIVTQRLLVVDIDPRNGGDVAFQGLALTEDFPKTLRSSTAGGGDHIIYRLPDHVFVSSGNNKLGTGIDVKSYGAYVVAAGSTIDGKSYAWGNDRPVALAPQWILDRQKAPKARSTEAGKRVVDEDETAVELALDWMRTRAPMAEIGNLNDTAYSVACRLFDYGVTADTAKEIMREWGDTHCNPRMWDELILHVIGSATKYRVKAIGSAHPGASGFEPYDMGTSYTSEAQRASPPAGLLVVHEFYPAARIGLTHRGRPLVMGILEQDQMSILYGESGSGKSFLALDIGHHVASGREWCGHKVKQGVVVYVSLEGTLAGMCKRFAALEKHYGREHLVHMHLIASPLDLFRNKADIDRLLTTIKSIETPEGIKVEMVIIDTLSRAMAGGDENSSTDMGAMVRNLDHIRKVLGCHLLVVHHTGKDATRGARGHSLLRAATDTEIEITKGKFSVTKQRDLEDTVKLSFQLQKVEIGKDEDGEPITSCHINMSGFDPHAIPLTALQKEIIELIMDEFPENKFSIKELAASVTRSGSNTSANRLSLRKHLKALEDTGRVTQDKQNVEFWQYVSE